MAVSPLSPGGRGVGGEGGAPAAAPEQRGGSPRPVWLPLLLGLLLVLGPAVPARAALNGAGLVVRHGDGRLVVAYVEFAEPRISGVDLLRRAGLSAVLAPAGYGEAVCAINGEGCRAEDCFCKSYGNPSVYWRYYQPRAGRWAYAALGPSARQLGDGDVDGWEWASGGPQLPLLTIDEIAARAGVRRSAPAPTAAPTAVPTATPVPPSPTSRAPVVPPSATPRPEPSPSPRPPTRAVPVAATSTIVPTSAPPAVLPASPTRPPVGAIAGPSPAATPTQAAASQTISTASPPPAPAAALATLAPAPVVPAPVASPTAAPPARATAAVVAALGEATPQARAVITAPGGETTPLPAAATPSVPWAGYGAALLAALALAAYLIWSARRRPRHGDTDAPDA